MMLDDLLRVVPGLRKLRSLNAELLRKLLDRSKGECTWCGGKIPKPRTRWCSDRCVAEFRERCDPSKYVQLVVERDGMVCRECGRDIKQSIEAAELEAKQKLPTSGHWEARERIERRHGKARGNWYEVDHIVPVVEGGGLCGLDNLRLVCGACHAVATRKLAGRRANK